VVTGNGRPLVLLDGTQLFSVETAQTALAKLPAAAGSPAPRVQILYNPELTTSWVMVPGLAGLILVFIGTLITSLGVVSRDLAPGVRTPRARAAAAEPTRAGATS
jgi:ABC-2 type transport system permease protein